MKTKKTVIIIIVFIFGVAKVFAEVPPSPPPNGRGAATANAVPSPPGTPIDGNIYLLIIIATLLGLYIIYNHTLKIKTPV